jgi:hypothetical protein
MKWRATPTDEMAISSVGVALHFICRCFASFHLSLFLSILSVGVALHFICWCCSPFHLSVFLSISSVGQMKWRETPTDEMESNTNR